MIRLSEDKRSVLTIRTFKELEERPGFARSLDVREKPLREVIGVYTLPAKVPCGISTCHTGHLRGYLSVVEGGQEICVGNVCGKRHFGTDWTQAKDAFQVIANAARYRENIAESQSRTVEWNEAAHALNLDINANGSAYQNMRIQMSTALPQSVQLGLKTRSKSGDALVTRARKATEDEREIAASTSSAGNNTSMIEETIYLIRGLAAVAGHAKLRQVEDNELQQKIESFANLDADTLNFDELKDWNRWQNQVETVLANLKQIHEECVRFLDPSNLASLRSYSSSI